MAVVVSAFGGVTDLLLNASKRASEQDVSYKNFVKEIEDRHIAAIRELIPVKSQSAALSKVILAVGIGQFKIYRSLAKVIIGYDQLSAVLENGVQPFRF